MSSTDKTTDESQLKQSYKERIRQYLPREWGDYKVDEFIDGLFKGLLYDPNTEFGRAISRITRKWIFKKLSIFDSGYRRIGEKYYPNPAVVRYNKENKKEQKSI